MDENDAKILGELRKNARATIRGIAKRTGIRPSTVHYRMQRLEEEVIEKYTVKTNNKAVGEGFIVFVLVKTESRLPETLFGSNVKEVFGITGSHDLLMKLKFENIEEFNRFIHKFRENESVNDTLTFVATKTIKELI